MHDFRFSVDHDVPKIVNYGELKYIKKKDLNIETLRYEDDSEGVTRVSESAVKITHIPTKLFYVAYTQRSQHMNRNKALIELNKLIGKGIEN